MKVGDGVVGFGVVSASSPSMLRGMGVGAGTVGIGAVGETEGGGVDGDTVGATTVVVEIPSGLVTFATKVRFVPS